MKNLLLIFILLLASACSTNDEVAFTAGDLKVTKSDLFHHLNMIKGYYPEIDSRAILKEQNPTWFLRCELYESIDDEKEKQLQSLNKDLFNHYNAMVYKTKYPQYLDSLKKSNILLYHHAKYIKTLDNASLGYLSKNNQLLYYHAMGLWYDVSTEYIDRLK